jgi:hypothetical protein
VAIQNIIKYIKIDTQVPDVDSIDCSKISIKNYNSKRKRHFRIFHILEMSRNSPMPKQKMCSTSTAHWRSAGWLFYLLFPVFLCACANPVSSQARETAVGASLQTLLTVESKGNGTVVSDDKRIDCGKKCKAAYGNSRTVTLTAHPGPAMKFMGWSSPCSGTGVCVLTMDRSVHISASFGKGEAAELDCTGPWKGSEETTSISAWPYRDCFRTDPVGTRTRMTKGAGAEVAWERGTGWNGQNALRVRPPDGSTGRTGQMGQGYAGLGEHYFHGVRTKRLNIRYLFRYNSNWALYAQRNKWEIAIKYDYSNPVSPVRRKSCERAIVEGRLDPVHENMAPRQGVCTDMDLAPNLNGWYWAPGVRENEWICVENEFDLETGWYRTYITTQDGAFNQSVHSEINIASGRTGAPAEPVPNPYWWGSIDCTTGCYWDSPADQGVVPRPADTYIWYSHVVINNGYIGPPKGCVRK